MSIEQIRPQIGPQWFAIRVKSRCEKMVAHIAENKGFENFLPLYRCRRRHSDRFRSVDLPLFPGYVFCRLDPQYRLPLLITPGVLHFVGLGKVPIPIDDKEIRGIQRIMEAGVGAEPWPFLEVGQKVSVDYGPLAGLEGLLIAVRKQHRVVVSVTLLKRSIAVEVERDWIRPPDMLRHLLCRNLAPARETGLGLGSNTQSELSVSAN